MMIGIKAVCVAALLLETKAHELVTSQGLRASAEKHNDLSSEHQPEESVGDVTSATGGNLVDFLYTFGGPAPVNGVISNPSNRCIPGVRTYTEDLNWGRITNSDFAAHWFASHDYPHPKISTLILRWIDNHRVEYIFRECKDSDNEDLYEWQWWPNKWATALIAPNVHHIGHNYQGRLKVLSSSVHDMIGPVLNYSRLSWCSSGDFTEQDVADCLLGLKPGASDQKFEGHFNIIGYMSHLSEWNGDTDRVYVAEIDANPDHRRCTITFEQSDGGTDLASFVGANVAERGYCGHTGVAKGVRDELWQLTHDPQYAANIKPALETCHEVTCVGYSLGGALCNVFTMCANQGGELLDSSDDAGMFDDWNSLKWTKP